MQNLPHASRNVPGKTSAGHHYRQIGNNETELLGAEYEHKRTQKQTNTQHQGEKNFNTDVKLLIVWFYDL